MAEQIVLEVTPRTVVGKANKRLRKTGIIPGNIYGHKEASTPIQIDGYTFEKLSRQHGTRNVLTLRITNAPSQTAVVRHVQRDPKSGHILHVDFSRVDLRERIEVKLPLHFVGEAPGVKNQGGVFLHLLDTLAVECEASAIVDSLDVDISSMEEIDSALHAKDVVLPAKYSLVTDPEEPIAKVDAPRVELAEPSATEKEAPAVAAEAQSEE
ncbi:MAG TPA: 50S ribosomal protein L25 [Dictyobacter sp.]|jgi:large subunit ribosomal protein L25|nr:50S ribosomal protein L25 [Dictyobacter sp.]